MWVTSPSRLKVPDEANLLSITYDQEGIYGCEDWVENCLNEKEGQTVKRSTIDGKPRVVNLDGPDMLRVGDWGRLEDPYKHQVRHMHLAKIRRAEPDRACEFCSYLLGHKCDLYAPAVSHCGECCLLMQEYSYNRDIKHRDERGGKGAQERGGHGHAHL